MPSKRTLRRAGLAAATATACLALIGAGGGCTTTSGTGDQKGPDTTIDGEPCQYFFPGTPTVQVVKRGRQIETHILSRCSKAPENHRVTVYLEKRNTYGNWDEVAKKDDDRAIGVGQTKTSKVTVPCTPGIYRVKFDASVLMPGAPTWDYGGESDERQTTIGKGDCR